MDAKIKRIWPEWEIDALAPDCGILGTGSFGDVYRIRRYMHGVTEYAALKIITIPRDARELNQLKQEYDTEEQLSTYYSEIKESFEKEYATMVMLRGHANIVYCDDIRFDPHADDLGWDIYIKMELLAPMMQHLPAQCSEELTRKLGIHICRALILCHKMGIIHRDIKPQNIFLSRDGNFKLGDFGIAKHMEGTQLGTMAGTEDYMAPEVNFFQPYSFQADIYSLGLVMYWMLNNYSGPFLTSDGSKPTYSQKMTARTKRLSGTPLPAPLYGSPAIKQVVMKACSFDSKTRYSSALEMLQALLALERSGEAVLESEGDATVVERWESVTKATVQTDNDATVFSGSLKSREDEAAKLIELLKKQNGQEETGNESSSIGRDRNSNQSEPYAQRPSRKNAVTETQNKKDTAQPYSYVPPKGSAVTQTAAQKPQSEPYSYVPPKKAVTYVPPKKPGTVSDGTTNKAQPTSTSAATVKTTAQKKASPHTQKKKKKHTWAWFLLILGFAFFAYYVIKSPTIHLRETVTDTIGTDYLSLLEIGYIEDPDGKLTMGDYVTDRFPSGSEYVSWYTFTGEKADNIQFEKISHLGNGLYQGKNDKEGINDLSLFTKEGEILLSQDACLMEWALNQDEDNPRYLLVFKAGSESYDEDNFLVSDEGNYITTYHSDGTMYNGTIRVFDAYLMRFVPNLPEITDDDAVDICGNGIVIHNQNSGSVMYNEDGQPIWESIDEPIVCNGYLISCNQGTYHIYDEQGNSTYTTNYNVSPVSCSIPYIRVNQYNGGQTGKVIDIYGNVVLEGYRVTDYHDGMFEVYTDNYEYGLVSHDGAEILPSKYDYIEEVYKGYCVAKYQGKYSLVSADGILATGLSESPYYLKIEKGDHLFLINKRSYDIYAPKGAVSPLTNGIVTIKSSDTGLLTVYDLFSGEALLPYEYERVNYAAGYLYAYREGCWGIFEVQFVRDGAVY